jgi:bHLH-MYC and R2R3-MYB transcription factors N-terminal
MELFPMSFELLDRAVEAKKKAYSEKKAKFVQGDDSTIDEVQAESSYLLMSHSGSTNSNGLPSSSDCYRTGRWTDEEIEFVDFLLQAFDRGVLPMPVGVRLNDFLCSVLLCKASRLTKKMKNARLSVRAHEILVNECTPALDCEMLTTLQEKFLQSIGNEAARLELRFNMDKAWRTNLSNLCVQVGCTMLDATAWIASLEQMEHRAALAEENIRKARRRRMGLALKTDVGAQQGVFFFGVPVQPPKKLKSMSEERKERSESTSTHSVTSSDGSDTNHISNMLDIGETSGAIDSVDDFAVIFDELIGGTPGASNVGSSSFRSNCGSFLEEVLSYMEAKQLPFEHVDVWVPSYAPQIEGGSENLRLHHAGHATRSELDPGTFCQLHEYGEYSTKFSFAPGVGLPGRVYKTGQPTWECHIDEADPKVFERAGGAKVYGIKTGVGIPISSSFIGRIVVAMYSLVHLNADEELLRQLTTDLVTFCPKPKWKLVVEMGSEAEAPKAPKDPPSAIIHYQHGTSALDAVKPSPNLLASMPVSAPSNISLATSDTKWSPDEMMVRNNSYSSCQSGSTSDTGNAELERDEEIRIATLLGDYMPGAEIPSIGEAIGPSNAPNSLLPYFMSLRLLLLRTPDKRSSDENALLDVMRKSYRGFSKDSNRSKKEIADLLAKDWRFLKTTAVQETKKPAAKRQAHQCHVMNAPAVNTYVATGVPVNMPPSLVADPEKSSLYRHSSFGDSAVHKKRRVSGDEPDPLPSFSFNIVDEG